MGGLGREAPGCPWSRMPGTGMAVAVLAGPAAPCHPHFLGPRTSGPWAIGAKGSCFITWLPRAPEWHKSARCLLELGVGEGG